MKVDDTRQDEEFEAKNRAFKELDELIEMPPLTHEQKDMREKMEAYTMMKHGLSVLKDMVMHYHRAGKGGDIDICDLCGYDLRHEAHIRGGGSK